MCIEVAPFTVVEVRDGIYGEESSRAVFLGVLNGLYQVCKIKKDLFHEDVPLLAMPGTKRDKYILEISGEVCPITEVVKGYVALFGAGAYHDAVREITTLSEAGPQTICPELC